MSNERLNLLISAPEGFEIIGTIPRSYMNDESCLIVRYDIKRTDINTSIEIEPSPHAELIAQCEKDKIDYPEFIGELWQFKHDDDNWETGRCCFKYDFEYRSHPHRASIIEFHQCSDEDKKRWQINIMGEWENITGKPDFGSTVEYRLRPRICQITIDGKVLEYPEPVRNIEIDEGYYLVNIIEDEIQYYEFHGESIEQIWLQNGVMQLTGEAAKQHLEVLQAVNAQVAR